MSYIDYKNKYPTLIQYKEAQQIFNEKLNQYMNLADEYRILVDNQVKEAEWRHIDGNLVKITAEGKDNLWGIDQEGNTYTCQKPCAGGDWMKKDVGSFKDLASDESTIYGISKDRNVYTTDQIGNSDWKKLGIRQQFDKISANNSDMIWGLKNSISVELRVILQCTGGDSNVSMKIKNITLKNGNTTLTSNNALGTINKNSDTTFNVSFTSSFTEATSINLIIGNDVKKKKDLFEKLYNDVEGFSLFKSLKSISDVVDPPINYPSLSNIKIQLKKDDGSYENIFSSSLNISTSKTNSTYTVSLGSGISFGNTLYHCEKPCDTENWQPVSSKFAIQNISSDDLYIYSVDNDNKIWRCMSDCSSGDWELDTMGKAKNIDGSGQKMLRVVGTDNNVYERDKMKWSEVWHSLQMQSTGTSMSNAGQSTINAKQMDNQEMEGRLWSVSTNNQVYNLLRPSYKKWRNVNDRNATVGVGDQKVSNVDWEYIGDFNIYEDCKLAALSSDTVFERITYFTKDYANVNKRKGCWGNKIGKKFQNQDDPNAITGYPPYGLTKLGGLKGVLILKRLDLLNEELIALTKYLKSITVPIQSTKDKMVKQKTAATKRLQKTLKSLRGDEQNLKKIRKQIKNIEAEKDNSDLILKQKGSVFVGVSIVMILLIILTIKQMKK
jgi:hypothetical protein